jgi:hypothetical protein
MHGSSDKSPRSEQPTRGGRKAAIRRWLTAVAAALAALALSTCGGDSLPASNTNGFIPVNALTVGNSFGGHNFEEVPAAAQDLAVAGDGVAFTGATWIESAHDVRAYTTAGRPVGPRPGSSAGRFRETGGGPLAVEATHRYLYAAQQRRLVRWDRSKFMNWSL